MDLHKDWFMRQVQMAVQMVVKLAFDKDTVKYEIHDESAHTDADMLYLQIFELLDTFKINEAENLLFESLDPDDDDHLMIAMEFYNRLAEIDPATLERCNFSQQEVEEGFKEIGEIFGVDIISG